MENPYHVGVGICLNMNTKLPFSRGSSLPARIDFMSDAGHDYACSMACLFLVHVVVKISRLCRVSTETDGRRALVLLWAGPGLSRISVQSGDMLTNLTNHRRSIALICWSAYRRGQHVSCSVV